MGPTTLTLMSSKLRRAAASADSAGLPSPPPPAGCLSDIWCTIWDVVSATPQSPEDICRRERRLQATISFHRHIISAALESDKRKRTIRGLTSPRSWSCAPRQEGAFTAMAAVGCSVTQP